LFFSRINKVSPIRRETRKVFSAGVTRELHMGRPGRSITAFAISRRGFTN
jgi:hypothetical protein